MAWLSLIAVIGFGLWAPGLSLVLRRLTRAFALYMGVAFVGRPLYLLAANPLQGSKTGLADPLLAMPTYWQGLQPVARLVLVGFISFLLCLYVVGFLTRNRWHPVELRHILDLRPYWLIWVACWICRISIHFGVFSPGSALGLVADRLLPLATALLGVLVLTTEWRSARGSRRAVFIMALGELLWSYVDTSKTPLLAALLFFYVDPERGRISFRLFCASVAGLVTAFLLIQSFKPGQAGHVDASLSIWQRLTVGILTRLDAVHAVAVAHVSGPGSYLSYGSVASRLLTGWIPQQLLGTHRLGAGELWAQLMNHSLPGVSLAQGPIAEGYAVAGFVGVVLWSVASALVLMGSAWIMSSVRRLVPDLFAAYIIASAALFEQGVIGLVDVIGSALQVCLICAILVLVAGGRRGPDPRVVSLRPQVT